MRPCSRTAKSCQEFEYCPVGTTRVNASSALSSPPWSRGRHGLPRHTKAHVKQTEQTGPPVFRPASVPQTTSPRHGAGQRIDGPSGAGGVDRRAYRGAPRERHMNDRSTTNPPQMHTLAVGATIGFSAPRLRACPGTRRAPRANGPGGSHRELPAALRIASAVAVWVLAAVVVLGRASGMFH